MSIGNNVVSFVILSTVLILSTVRAEKMNYIDNGSIKIGVDLDQEGTITFLARSQGGENLINCHDLGRQIQQSYYSGPHPFGKAHPGWKNWPWNPIGSGDVYKHPSRILEHTNDEKTIYVKTIPMQWALDNVPGECTFETWITLDGQTALVRNRLDNHRPDKIQYPAHDQELPALYTIGKLYRLFTYTDDRPFTNQPLKQRWRAKDVPKLFVRAAFRTHGDHAEIFWSVPDGGFSPERRVAPHSDDPDPGC